MWKQCSFLQSSSLWTLRKCVSPSDASPDGKWLADCLKGIKVNHTWQGAHCGSMKHTVGTVERLTVFIQNSPVKFPLITYGMMPSGHTRSGLEVAALLQRRSVCLSAALVLLTLSVEEEPLTAISILKKTFIYLNSQSELFIDWYINAFFATWVCVVDRAAVDIFEHAEVVFIEGNVSQEGSWGEQMNTLINKTYIKLKLSLKNKLKKIYNESTRSYILLLTHLYLAETLLVWAISKCFMKKRSLKRHLGSFFS